MSANGTFADRVARQLGVRPADLAGTGRGGSATLHDVLRQAGRAAPAAARPPPDRTFGGADGEGPEAAETGHRWETACDAGPIRQTCAALAALAPEPPGVLPLVVRLCGAALRDLAALHRPPPSGGADRGKAPAAVGLLAAGPDRTVEIPDAVCAGVGAIHEAMRPPPRPEAEDPVRSPRPPPALVVRTPDAPRSAAVLRGAPAAAATGADRAVLTVREAGETLGLVLECGAGGVFPETGEAFLAALRTLCLDPRRALL